MIKTWRFITIMFVALSMGMAFCHLMEMPVRLEYDPALWIRVMAGEGTYRYFGPPVGAILEGGAWLTAIVLAILVRNRPSAFSFTLFGAVCIVAAHVAWWLFVFPVNEQMIHWTPEAVPAGFSQLRDRWEYAHAVRAVLQITGLAALVLSLLAEMPARHRDEIGEIR